MGLFRRKKMTVQEALDYAMFELPIEEAKQKAKDSIKPPTRKHHEPTLGEQAIKGYAAYKVYDHFKKGH